MKKELITCLLLASMLTATCGCGSMVEKAKSITGNSTERAMGEQPETETKKEPSADNIEAIPEEKEADPVEDSEPEITPETTPDEEVVEEETSSSKADKSGEEHSFYGWYSSEWIDGPWIFVDFDRSADDITYNGIVTVELDSDQIQYVKDHSYEEFKITYVYGSDMKEPIDDVEKATIEVVSDEEVVKGLIDAGSDPLAGLVADDILEKFRASRPVQKTDSIYREAHNLGRWVMKTIGKDGFSQELREKGEHIGAANEYCFGTDIGNNFSNNIPYMYAEYFTLKDYFASDGVNGKEHYDDLMDWNYDLGNGDAENIKEMYNDLQVFITECNNIIREK
ncbi:hypothetical protein [Butyrivibrio sp. JL13D10]|uniref:hypothetical protein n=1 Tax=Butyrivibrio sp. JL13D10 TaxID=3236815 RepID=UPI0038B528A8